jgi:hypothetical protein
VSSWQGDPLVGSALDLTSSSELSVLGQVEESDGGLACHLSSPLIYASQRGQTPRLRCHPNQALGS